MNSNRYPLPAQTGLVVAPGLPPKNSTLRPDQLNKRLSSAWHHLYDLCPELLKIDPPDGLTILRGFLQWAAEQKAAWNWAMHLRLYCWLLQSPFGAKVTDEHLEVLMDASAARWTVDDTSANRGILLASQGGAHITRTGRRRRWRRHACAAGAPGPAGAELDIRLLRGARPAAARVPGLEAVAGARLAGRLSARRPAWGRRRFSGWPGLAGWSRRCCRVPERAGRRGFPATPRC